ncbi:uncharacterized protein LOC108025938 [Drosophila biarmipes]|uniref:uncharacterized protein LOC108025938 n=1 Tax=Drosophila biarmipes TaxID=125945 RepID=UPI0021CCCC3F|nr:uncharacterized protein LOC108025938 [Drosophila biarmipes]
MTCGLWSPQNLVDRKFRRVCVCVCCWCSWTDEWTIWRWHWTPGCSASRSCPVPAKNGCYGHSNTQLTGSSSEGLCVCWCLWTDHWIYLVEYGLLDIYMEMPSFTIPEHRKLLQCFMTVISLIIQSLATVIHSLASSPLTLRACASQIMWK